MSFVLLILILIGFAIYMFVNDGYIYISSKHFEKEISVKKIKEKNQTNMGPRCERCGGYIDNGQKICSNCINKELEEYSSSNPFAGTKAREQKNTRTKF